MLIRNLTANHVYIICGYTDMRLGIDGLAAGGAVHRSASRCPYRASRACLLKMVSFCPETLSKNPREPL